MKYWKCTNPKCGKILEIAKLCKRNNYIIKGTTILECSECGFEFLSSIEHQASNNLNQDNLSLAVLRKKVKEFNLS